MVLQTIRTKPCAPFTLERLSCLIDRGDLSVAEVKQIQDMVDDLRFDVVIGGGAARGARRGRG